MNVIDRAIGVLSPKWALERAYWRTMQASYKGGVPTRTSESWATTQAYRFGMESERRQLGNARDRAYQAWRNNPVARTLIQTETDNVICDGLNYQPTTDSQEWNKEAEDRYYEWLEVASVRGGDIQSGCELQRLLWERSRVAGDIGWILVSRGSDSFIQIVSAENIVTPDGMYGDQQVYDGIRFDDQGRPIEFYVLGQDERNGTRNFIPIQARDFVYFSHMTEPTQARGESCFITIFDLLSHLDRYIDGVSLAAWMGTVIGLIFKRPDSARQLGALPTLTNSQGNQQKAITLENGSIQYVGTEGETVQVDAKQPMQQTSEFIRAMYRMVGQPFDMPLEVLAKDMSTVNFASARIGLLPFYRSCRIKAGRFGSRWSRTIRWWLSRERLRAPDDPKAWKTPFPENYWNHDLLINAWDYTDPVSEAQADLLQFNMKSKSMQMIIAERGRNVQKILTDIEAWEKKTAGMPEVYSTMTRDPAPEPVAQPPQPENGADTVKAYARAFRDLLTEE